MAQAQLDAFNFSLKSDDFLSIQCEFLKRRIMCCLDADTFLVIKRTRKDSCIFLKKGKTGLKLKPETYELICDT